MGYYDNEPQAAETESTIEMPTDAFEGMESQAADATETESGAGLLRGRP